MLKLLSFILVLYICVGCANPNEPGAKNVRKLTVSEENLVESDNRFGFKLFKEIVKEEKDKNIFISPLSVSMALGMAYNGADGDTQEAMQTTLELSGLTTQEVNDSYKSLIELLTGLDPKVTFRIANSIWYRQGFPVEDEFIDLNKANFNAEVSGLDFDSPEAPSTINGWVDKNTGGKIKKIVDDSIDPMTVMFLINAIYFKDDWASKFDESETKDDLFTLPDGSKIPCKMMVQTGDFKYFSNGDFAAIDLPYGDGDFSMTVFLPNQGKGVDSLIAEFSQENWDLWMNSFSEHKVALEFPKFTLEYELKLNDALKALGMEVAFDPSRADFRKMYKEEEVSENLYISQVKHKTFVEANEEGTEAAAVTSVEVGVTSAPIIITMRVDRPFVFAIRESHSQTILFIGKIVRPT